MFKKHTTFRKLDVSSYGEKVGNTYSVGSFIHEPKKLNHGTKIVQIHEKSPRSYRLYKLPTSLRLGESIWDKYQNWTGPSNLLNIPYGSIPCISYTCCYFQFPNPGFIPTYPMTHFIGMLGHFTLLEHHTTDKVQKLSNPEIKSRNKQKLFFFM
jgi:hypothetical protein